MRKPLIFALCMALAALLGCVGYWLLFTTFSAHDDEGYVLWTARQLCEGRPLYSEVYTQYGPAFYAWYRTLHAVLGLAFTSESARWLTLFYWLVAAGACGWMTWRLTRSVVAGSAGCLLTFAALHEMIREPFHPGGFLAALAAVGVARCSWAVLRDKQRTFALWGGAVGMAMALTKINVGAFFFVALGSWVALHLCNKRFGWAILATVALGTMGAPLVLMKLLREEEWIGIFQQVFIAGGLAMLTSVYAVRRPDFTWKVWGWMASAAGTVVLICVLFAWATGTSLPALWDGVVVAPLRHPGVVTYPVLWIDGARECAIAGLALAVLSLLSAGRRPWRAPVLAVLRLLGGVAVLVQLTGFGYANPFHVIFQFGPALAWLMAMPLQPLETDAAARGRAWLGWCAVWQILQAYPVAGSQAAWGSFLFVPLVVAGSYEAAMYLGARWPRAHWAPALAGGVLAILGLVSVAQLGSASLVAYLDREPLELAGAESLRLPPQLTGEARVLSRNVATHSHLLFTTPGMLSFNLWSQTKTPTAANVTVWGALLSPAQKLAIAERLKSDRTAMVISRVTGGRVYAPEGFMSPFQPAIHLGDYMLWTWKGVEILPLGTARFEKVLPGSTALAIYTEGLPQTVAALHVRSSLGHQIVASILVSAERPWRILPRNLALRETGVPRVVAQPFNLEERAILQVPLENTFADLNPDLLEVVLLDSRERVIQAFRINKVSVALGSSEP